MPFAPDTCGMQSRGRNPRMTKAAFAAAAACFLVACSSSRDLVESTAPSRFRAGAEPIGSVLVRLKADMRPREERGVRQFVGTSYLGGNDLVEPTDVSLLRILARDIKRTGVAADASFQDDEQPYILDASILHLGASYSEGVESFTMVLPTSSIQAKCAVRLELRDRAGRVFLDEVFEREERRGGARLTGLERDAARALSAAIRGTVDDALPKLAAAVGAYWSKYR